MALHLTPRQRQALELLTQGLLVKQVAGRLGLTDSTVSAYLRLAVSRNKLRTTYQLVHEFTKETQV